MTPSRSKLISTALRRGWRKRCPHCGEGPLFSGWSQLERCSICGLVFTRNPGDTWAFIIVGDRLPIGALIVLIYFGVVRSHPVLGLTMVAVLLVLLVWTTPNRWGASISLHYLSRVFWPDPADPIPPSPYDPSGAQVSDLLRVANQHAKAVHRSAKRRWTVQGFTVGSSQSIDPPRETVGSVCTCEQLTKHRRDTLAQRSMIMSASHHPTETHLRQHRAKKRNKLRARIAAAPASGRAALEAKVQRTYSTSHSIMKEKLPPVVV